MASDPAKSIPVQDALFYIPATRQKEQPSVVCGWFEPQLACFLARAGIPAILERHCPLGRTARGPNFLEYEERNAIHGNRPETRVLQRLSTQGGNHWLRVRGAPPGVAIRGSGP